MHSQHFHPGSASPVYSCVLQRARKERGGKTSTRHKQISEIYLWMRFCVVKHFLHSSRRMRFSLSGQEGFLEHSATNPIPMGGLRQPCEVPATISRVTAIPLCFVLVVTALIIACRLWMTIWTRLYIARSLFLGGSDNTGLELGSLSLKRQALQRRLCCLNASYPRAAP